MNNLSLRKKILYYWLPPLLLMAIIFPVGNRTLSSHHLYQLFSGLFRMLDPDASASLVRLAYIIIRKSFHFLAYGCLAYFFFRAFRGASRVWWKSSWAWGPGSWPPATAWSTNCSRPSSRTGRGDRSIG